MTRVVDALPELSFADAAAVVREPVASVRSIGQGSRARVYRVETVEGAVRVVRLSAKGGGRAERERAGQRQNARLEHGARARRQVVEPRHARLFERRF